jgi:hypothetical protein
VHVPAVPVASKLESLTAWAPSPRAWSPLFHHCNAGKNIRALGKSKTLKSLDNFRVKLLVHRQGLEPRTN